MFTEARNGAVPGVLDVISRASDPGGGEVRHRQRERPTAAPSHRPEGPQMIDTRVLVFPGVDAPCILTCGDAEILGTATPGTPCRSPQVTMLTTT